MTDHDDSDSDEWGMEELVVPQKDPQLESHVGGAHSAATDDHDDDVHGSDDDWAVKIATDGKKDDESKNAVSLSSSSSPREPMLIVDITQLDPMIHSKFDRASVNDSEGASALRKLIEGNYTKYANDSEMLADGTVIPCGSSVWRDALVKLRDDRPGHYFAPIFPPSESRTKTGCEL